MTTKKYAIIAGLLYSACAVTPQPAIAARSDAPVEYRHSRGSLFEWSPLIQQIQNFLVEFDLFAGPADGRLTAGTRRAVRTYQKQSGIAVDGDPDEELLKHMEGVGRAEALKQRLARARDEQIERAREALAGNPATRDLVHAGEVRTAALPADGSRECLRAPSVDCLLSEASAAIAMITRDDYRDWALRDVIRARAMAGRMAQAREGIKRLSDLRLVLVSLREAAAALARAGHIGKARALTRTIPDPWNRARALLAIAKTGAGLPLAYDALMALLPNLEDKVGAVEIAAELAVDLADRGLLKRAEKAIAAIDGLPGDAAEADTRRIALGAVATALARIGRSAEALGTLRRIGEAGRDHIALAEAAGMLARKGKFREAQAMADRLRAPQLYVLALTRIASAQSGLGDSAAAKASLARAEAAVLDIERPFAGDAARGRIAAVWSEIPDYANAFANVAKIKSHALKAQTLWRLAVDSTTPAGGDAEIVSRAEAATERIESAFDRAATLARAANEFAEAGRGENAKAVFGMAVRETMAIKDSWWRARILSLLATALVAID